MNKWHRKMEIVSSLQPFVYEESVISRAKTKLLA